jgi:SAM-dependent methyltransferase
VIDIGGGGGRFLQLLKESTQESVNIDPNPMNCKLSIEKGIPSICKNFEEIDELPFEADIITCFEVIEHLYSPIYLIKKAHSNLAKNGTFVISTPNAFNIVRGFKYLFFQKLHDPLCDPSINGEEAEHVRLYSFSLVEKLLLNAGFSEIRSYGFATICNKKFIFKINPLKKYLSQGILVLAFKN